MSTLDPIDIFRIEAGELLEQIEQGLLDLEQRPDDRDQIDSVFRGLHTLKGSGAMFGFDALAAFTHHCETAFDRVRKGLAPATPELLAAVLAARDHMRALVENAGGDYASQEAELLARICAAAETTPDAPGAAAANAAAPAPAPVAARRWRLRFALPQNAMINGANPLTFLDDLRDLGPCDIQIDASATPPLDEIDPTALYLRWTVQLETEASRGEIEDVFLFVMDDMTLELDELRTPAAPVEPAPAPVEAAPEAAPQAASHPAASAKAAPDAHESRRRTVESVRVPADRLDELMDRVGELVIAQSRLSQIAAASMNEDLRAVSEEIENLSSELRATMMVLRMVPVATLFERFRRLARDLQHETGKQI
ncbi:chemotaxis protein CheA, partial [Rhodoblastus acidophilus]